jgi:Spy/CpxP family protein refolding chaperone
MSSSPDVRQTQYQQQPDKWRPALTEHRRKLMTATIKRIVLGVGASIVALGVTAGVYAYAQDQNTNQDPRPFRGRGMGPGGRGGPMGPGGPMGMLPMFGARLGLTDAQKDQVKTIAESHKEEWKSIADRARTAHAALEDAVTSDAIDEGLIRQRSAEVGAVEADMAVARARAFAEVVQILTADQKAQLKTMQAEMKKRMKGRQQAGREHHGRLLERFGL